MSKKDNQQERLVQEYHNEFYNVMTFNENNFIDFNTSTFNSPKIFNLLIQNNKSSKLKLNLKSSKANQLYIFKVNQNIENKDSLKTWTPKITERSEIVDNLQSFKDIIIDSIDERYRNQKRPIIEKNNPKKDFLVTNITSPTTNAAQNVASVSTLEKVPNKGFRNKFEPEKISKSTSYLDLASDKKNYEEKREFESNTDYQSMAPKTASLDNKEFQNLTLITPRKDSSLPKRASIATRINKITTDLLTFERQLNFDASLYATPQADEEYVKTISNIKRELENFIKNDFILPIEEIEIKPSSPVHLALIFCPKSDPNLLHLEGKSKNYTFYLNIKMLEYDYKYVSHIKKYNELDFDPFNPPSQNVLIKSSVCKSTMTLDQYNINFGLIDKDDVRIKYIVIRNNSEIPLLYSIRKSGSIASGDIQLEGERFGVVRSYGKKLAGFIFSPSLPGNFHEIIKIKNIMDPTNDQCIKIKAMVRKPSTFDVGSLIEDFGPCFINEICYKQIKIQIMNNHKHPRVFEIRYDSNELNFGWCFGEIYFNVEENNTKKEIQKNLLGEDILEQIEVYEQKLKIAIRKNQPDKISSIEVKLARLKSGELEVEPQGEGDESGSAELLETNSNENLLKNEPSEELTIPLKSLPGYGELGFIQKKSNTSIVFTIGAKSMIEVNLQFKPIPTQAVLEYLQKQMLRMTRELVSGQIYVNEHRNRDVYKRIIFKALVFYDQSYFSDFKKVNSDYVNSPKINSPVIHNPIFNS